MFEDVNLLGLEGQTPLHLAARSFRIEEETISSTKSLQIIFPLTSQTKYEPMFLLQKIAVIYIELVVKRDYKVMTNWPFRHLAR